MCMKYGMDLANELGLEVVLEATNQGFELYRRLSRFEQMHLLSLIVLQYVDYGPGIYATQFYLQGYPPGTPDYSNDDE